MSVTNKSGRFDPRYLEGNVDNGSFALQPPAYLHAHTHVRCRLQRRCMPKITGKSTEGAHWLAQRTEDGAYWVLTGKRNRAERRQLNRG